MPLKGALIAMSFRAQAQLRCVRPRGERTRSRISLRSSLELVPHFKAYSRSDKACALFGAVSIFTLVYSCLSSALAEVEEGNSQNDSKSGYSITTLSVGTATNIFTNNSEDDVKEYLSTRYDIDYSHTTVETYAGDRVEFPTFKNQNSFDYGSIPATVWSIDRNTEVNLDNISARPDSEVYTISTWRPEVDDFWNSAIPGWWGGNPHDALDLPVGPTQFQVASCGGASAEHGNLDYCNNGQLVVDQYSDHSHKSEQGDSDTESENAGDNAPSSADATESNSSAQPSIASFPLGIVTIKPVLRGTLSVLGACGDVTLSCTTTQIAPPETPFDSPSLSDDLTPSIDEAPAPGPIAYISEPGSGPSLPPVFTPQPLKPIPEASTWVMTIIGFSIMVFVFRKRRRTGINPISIIDDSEISGEL